jgi:hypothetical protein
VLTITLTQLLLEPFLLNLQLVDRLLLETNGLFQISDRLPQFDNCPLKFTHQFDKLTDAQRLLVTAFCRRISVHPRLIADSPRCAWPRLQSQDRTATILSAIELPARPQVAKQF